MGGAAPGQVVLGYIGQQADGDPGSKPGKAVFLHPWPRLGLLSSRPSVMQTNLSSPGYFGQWPS